MPNSSIIAPLIAAGSLSLLFGPEHDPAHELTLSTPTSSWKLLLARLSIVSAYNLMLAIIAMLILMIAFPPGLLGTLALGMLAPMAFLSALALLLSIWIGTSNAIAISISLVPAVHPLPIHRRGRFRLPGHPSWLLTEFGVALCSVLDPLLLIALWSANRPALTAI
jgi:hypothetical protein